MSSNLIIDEILDSIKTMIGLDVGYTPFDKEITMYINMAIASLKQMGVGNSNFILTSPTDTWTQFLGANYDNQFEMVKTYIFLRVKKLFDPSASSTVMESINSSITELEWRINSKVDF